MPIKHYFLPYLKARSIVCQDIHFFLLGLGTGAHLLSSATRTCRGLKDSHPNMLTLNRLHHSIVANNLIYHIVLSPLLCKIGTKVAYFNEERAREGRKSRFFH